MEEDTQQTPSVVSDNPTALGNKKLKISVWKMLLILLMVFILSVAGYFAYRKYQDVTQVPITSYEECVLAQGSLIQESYPLVCVTIEGIKFTQDMQPDIYTQTESEICYESVMDVECPEGPCLSNPASSFCECMGGSVEIRTNEDGDQYGVCLIDGTEHDEWEYFEMMNPQEDEVYDGDD